MFLVLLVTFVSAETCEELGGEVCTDDQMCNGVEVEMDDRTTCCTLIGCIDIESVQEYAELENEIYRSEAGEEDVTEEVNWLLYGLIGFGVLVLLLLLVVIMRRPKKKIVNPSPRQVKR